MMKKIICTLTIVIMMLSMFSGCRTTHSTYSDEEEDAKPVIYLYPEEETNVFVELEYTGELTCTYPDYNEGWDVTAYPDGQLINNLDNKEYSYLFWEGVSAYNWEMNEGFVIKGENTKDFLQEKLAYIGLEPKEYNEFIVYWLPKMEKNNYNLIYFAGDEYAELAKLKVSPEPESMLRVFMVYKPLDDYIDIPEQDLTTFEREGFTLIEWGGKELIN